MREINTDQSLCRSQQSGPFPPCLDASHLKACCIGLVFTCLLFIACSGDFKTSTSSPLDDGLSKTHSDAFVFNSLSRRGNKFSSCPHVHWARHSLEPASFPVIGSSEMIHGEMSLHVYPGLYVLTVRAAGSSSGYDGSICTLAAHDDSVGL